jgi:hypothetical protein
MCENRTYIVYCIQHYAKALPKPYAVICCSAKYPTHIVFRNERSREASLADLHQE